MSHPIILSDPIANPAIQPCYSGTIQSGLQTHTIYLKRVDLIRHESLAISPQQPTWIVIHGWNHNTATATIRRLAHAIAQWSQTQVLTLDWSTLVDVPLHQLGTRADAIPLVAAWVSQQLLQLGFAPQHLNLVGHSVGCYIAAEIAAQMPSCINQLIALDPAANLPNFKFSPVNFRRNTRFSWAFYGSLAGSAKQAATADAAFSIDFGYHKPAIFKNHARVVKLFTALLHHCRNNPTHALNQHFQFDQGDRTQPLPWKAERFSKLGGRMLPGIGVPFSGRLHTRQSTDGRWVPFALQYRACDSTDFDRDVWIEI
jgi:pimeloyl-ACP methyl ester carboxylesterase